MNRMFKIAGVGILMLTFGLPASAEMTPTEVRAQVDAALQKGEHSQADRQKWLAAVDALINAGVVPEQSAELIQSALSKQMSGDEALARAREIEHNVQGGDKALAEKYAGEFAAHIEVDRGADFRQMRDELSSRGAAENFGAGAARGEIAGGAGIGRGEVGGGAGFSHGR